MLLPEESDQRSVYEAISCMEEQQSVTWDLSGQVTLFSVLALFYLTPFKAFLPSDQCHFGERPRVAVTQNTGIMKFSMLAVLAASFMASNTMAQTDAEAAAAALAMAKKLYPACAVSKR